MKACVALVCLLGAVDFANAARAGNVGGSLRGRQRTLSYGESLAMGRTACTIYGRPVSQETELDEFKDSGCKIGGTDDKPVSCTDTELCVLKHVYGVVDQSVKAMNKVLPKNGKVSGGGMDETLPVILIGLSAAGISRSRPVPRLAGGQPRSLHKSSPLFARRLEQRSGRARFLAPPCLAPPWPCRS